MIALYRSSRRADALAVYRRTWRLLREELGVEPGPALQSLHERILLGDPDIDAQAGRCPELLGLENALNAEKCAEQVR